MPAHGALAAALLNPVLNALRVVVVTARALQLRDHVVRAERRHADDALVLFADCAEQLL